MATHSTSLFTQNAPIPQVDKDMYIKSFILSQKPFAKYYASQGLTTLENLDGCQPDKDRSEEQNARGIFSSPVLQPRVPSNSEPQKTSPKPESPPGEDRIVLTECIQRSVSNKRPLPIQKADPSATRLAQRRERRRERREIMKPKILEQPPAHEVASVKTNKRKAPIGLSLMQAFTANNINHDRITVNRDIGVFKKGRSSGKVAVTHTKRKRKSGITVFSELDFLNQKKAPTVSPPQYSESTTTNESRCSSSKLRSIHSRPRKKRYKITNKHPGRDKQVKTHTRRSSPTVSPEAISDSFSEDLGSQSQAWDIAQEIEAEKQSDIKADASDGQSVIIATNEFNWKAEHPSMASGTPHNEPHPRCTETFNKHDHEVAPSPSLDPSLCKLPSIASGLGIDDHTGEAPACKSKYFSSLSQDQPDMASVSLMAPADADKFPRTFSDDVPVEEETGSPSFACIIGGDMKPSSGLGYSADYAELLNHQNQIQVSWENQNHLHDTPLINHPLGLDFYGVQEPIVEYDHGVADFSNATEYLIESQKQAEKNAWIPDDLSAWHEPDLKCDGVTTLGTSIISDAGLDPETTFMWQEPVFRQPAIDELRSPYFDALHDSLPTQISNSQVSVPQTFHDDQDYIQEWTGNSDFDLTSDNDVFGSRLELEPVSFDYLAYDCDGDEHWEDLESAAVSEFSDFEACSQSSQVMSFNKGRELLQNSNSHWQCDRKFTRNTLLDTLRSTEQRVARNMHGHWKPQQS